MDSAQQEFDRLYQEEGELLFGLRDGRYMDQDEFIEVSTRLDVIGDRLEELRDKIAAEASEKDKKIVEGGM